MNYKYVCSNNPQHLFEEPTFDYWCDKCPIEKRSMLVTYTGNVVEEVLPKKEEPPVIINEPTPIDSNNEINFKIDDTKIIDNQELKQNEKKNEEAKPKRIDPVIKPIPTIKIGKQLWMSENLKTKSFLNNDSIFHAKSEKDWILAGEKKMPAWCYPNNDSKLGDSIGKLYNWYAVSDPRGIFPKGMRIPEKNDIFILSEFLISNGEDSYCLKSKINWKRKGCGSDNYNMNMLPYGKRYPFGTFAPEGYCSAYWTTSEHIHYTAFFWELRAENNEIKLGKVDKNAGFLIRCIKN